MIRISRLGHLVLRVRNLERSLRFYRDVLGLTVVSQKPSMAFFRIDETNHHDLAIMEVGEAAASPSPQDVGMYHFALKIGEDIDELKKAITWLEQNQVRLVGRSDHGVAKSLYLLDPDGNEIELYVDADPSLWRQDPGPAITTKPLDLD